MSHLEQAIKDAVEKGGWGRGEMPYGATALDFYQFVLSTGNQTFLLDPAFWQALGKARGWENQCNICYMTEKQIADDIAEYSHSSCRSPKLTESGRERAGHEILLEWKWQWHSLIGDLASGKDIESFFKSL